MFKSGASGTARIELDQNLKRITVKDSTDASKVVMGYLNGLAKNDGTGNWGAGDYGFWAASGDYLKIDGDVDYKSGDWIVRNDGSLLINNAADQTIVRLGTDTAEKGLFIYNTSGTQLAKYTSTDIVIGLSTTEHIEVSSTAIQMKNGASVLVDLTNAVLTLGDASNEHVEINSTSVQIKDNTSVYTDLTGGVLTLGLVSGGEYLTVDGTNGIKMYGGGTLYTQLTNAGALYLGDQSNEHVLINGSGMAVNDGATNLATFAATTTIGTVAGGEYVSISSSGIAMYGNAAQRVNIANDGTGWLGTSGGITWDASGNITLSGALSAGTIDIGGDDATSFHVDNAGGIWSGASVANKATAPFRVSNAGAAVLTSATIGNWSVNTTSIYTGTEDHSGYTANAGDITIYSDGSDSSIHAKNFYIDTAGSITAQSATISGDITATSGYFQSVTLGKTGVASGTLTLQINDGAGDTYIASGKTDFGTDTAGFILGLDDSDSNKPKFEIQASERDYLKYNGSNVLVGPDTKLLGSDAYNKDNIYWHSTFA
jgi:hypothetical protein